MVTAGKPVGVGVRGEMDWFHWEGQKLINWFKRDIPQGLSSFQAYKLTFDQSHFQITDLSKI